MRATPAVLTVSLALLTAACADRGPGPTSSDLSAARSGVPFTSGLASPTWQGTTAARVAQALFPPTSATRAYALVGVAQYLAVQRAEGAEGGGGRNLLELDRGAVAGASAVVLTYLFPTQAQAFEDQVAAQGTAGPGGGAPHPAFTRGEVIGRAVGAAIVTRAQGDGFNTPFSGTIPTGPGFWVSNTTPPTIAGGQLPTTLPWFLTSVGQFRSAPPPAFGSAAFLAGLAEVRQISDTRTAEQTQIAAFWALNAGTPTASGFWMQVATDGIEQQGLSEREATHLYALLATTMFDAQIGCWDAKMTYWYIRPWRADAAITTTAAVGKPNHPSYPSGHSCVSSSGAEVLSAFFPEQRAHLDAMVIEAGRSRVYGGIHYTFDIEAGQTLGRGVARFTIAADASGNSVLTPH
jgi:membrane-associated phospholipid phosphatase